MSRWCDCKAPKTRNIASRRCLLCGKLIRLKSKDSEIRDWQIIKDPAFNNCCLIDFGKRTIKFNPKLYWVRYAGTKKAPQVYVYAIVKQEHETKMEVGDVVEIFEDPLTCKKSEGKARLLKLLQIDDERQYWRVQFLADKSIQYRWVKKKEI